MPGVKGKTNGIKFTKGDPRCGRPKMPPEQKGLQKLTKTKFSECANKFLHMTRSQILIALEDKTANMIDLMVGGIILEAAANRDTNKANFILDRLVSRLKLQDDYDPNLNVVPEAGKETAPTYLVEINTNGKFIRSRPRELLLAEATEEENKQTVNG